MSEFTIHHHASELLKLLRAGDGDGPEVYAELLTRDLTPYVTTQVSAHTAKKKIAEASPNPREFLKKYEELKSRNIRELDSFVYLLSCIVQDRQTSRFLEKDAKGKAKAREQKVATSKSTFGLNTQELQDLTDSMASKSPMTKYELNELRLKLSNIASSTTQNSADDLIKALREKQAKKTGGGGLPVPPSWTLERPYLSGDFVDKTRTQQLASVGTLPLQLQELSVIEDLLFLMMGIEGKYVMVKDNGDKKQSISFSIDRTLDTSLQELVNRILPICACYSTICRFIDDHSRFEHGLVSHGLCSAMRNLLKEYLIFVAQLEHQFRQGELSLQKMWFFIQPSMTTVEILSNIATMVEKGNCKGGSILTLLHEKTEGYIGDSKARDLCLFLTQSACAPYFEMLELWIYKGLIKDPYSEFLVAEHESFQKEKVTEDYNDAYWDQHYTVVRDRIPVFLERVAEKILRTGKYLGVIRQCGLNVICPHAVEIMYTLKEREYVEQIEEAYEYASHQLLDLLMTEKKLMARLRSLKHYFLLDQGDFFVCFMDLAEDEMKKMANDIIRSRLEALLELALRTSAANNDVFKDDLTCNLLPYDLISQLLRILSVTQGRGGASTFQDPTEMQISGLEAFTLDYVVKWPLSLILSKKALTKYQMLFRHLFYSKHVERQLCSLWLSNQLAKKNTLQSISWHSAAFTLRTRMIHFVQNFEYYMMFEVIEPNWQLLEENLRTVSNIDGVLEHHNDFLDRCLKDCMLTNPELLKIVSKLMMVCVTFSNCIQRYNLSSGVNNPNDPTSVQSLTGRAFTASSRQTSTEVVAQHISQMMSSKDVEKTVANFDRNFTKQLIELLDKLSMYSTRDCEQQMMNMVSRLDHNGFYSEHQRNLIAKGESTVNLLESLADKPPSSRLGDTQGSGLNYGSTLTVTNKSGEDT